jgi:hypothetical protein
LDVDAGRSICRALCGAALIFLTGCAWFGGAGKLKIGDNSVTPVANAGKPATLATFNAGEYLPLSAGSRFTITRYKAVAGQPATKDTPAIAPQPEREVTEIVPASDTQWQKTEASVKADSGAIDQSVALKKVEVGESRPLLYASILSALAAGFFVYRAYPTPALACGGASVVFFLAWKISGIPDWFYAVGVACLVGGAALYLGHERGLYTPVPDDKKTP